MQGVLLNLRQGTVLPLGGLEDGRPGRLRVRAHRRCQRGATPHVPTVDGVGYCAYPAAGRWFLLVETTPCAHGAQECVRLVDLCAELIYLRS